MPPGLVQCPADEVNDEENDGEGRQHHQRQLILVAHHRSSYSYSVPKPLGQINYLIMVFLLNDARYFRLKYRASVDTVGSVAKFKNKSYY